MNITDPAVPRYDNVGCRIPTEPPYFPNRTRMLFYRCEDGAWVTVVWRKQEPRDGLGSGRRVYHLDPVKAAKEVPDRRLILELHKDGYLIDTRLRHMSVEMLEEIQGTCTDLQLQWLPMVELVRSPTAWKPRMLAEKLG